ncbi:MAG: hypothetical protein ICV65_18015 [Flavisolibacter sp.]|nr:hypothetical protein [Flavisolibacter sp.]
MPELIINIAPQKEALVRELIKQLGGRVETKKQGNKKAALQKKSKDNIDHSFLFGKWKDYDIDAGKLREELWKRS